MSLTHEELLKNFYYDPETGILIRIQHHSSRYRHKPTGSVGGNGYVYVKFNYKTYLAHRLVWFYIHGEWPAEMVDHINGNKSDNRLVNLRSVPRYMNAQNERKARVTCKSKLMGAYPNHKTWKSAIYIDGKKTHLGCFETAELAHAAYMEAKRKHHEGFML
jgi:hypothetical protein